MITYLIEKIRTLFQKNEPAAPRSTPKPTLKPTPKQAPVPPPTQETTPPITAKPKKNKWDVSHFDVPEHPGKTRFHDLGLPDIIMRGIHGCHFEYCTPIQAEILPKALEGMDVTGKAQTGTGKSAAFLITIYTRLLRKPPKKKGRPGTPRALILAPTRELAIQIQKDAEQVGRYSKSRILSVFGGMDYEKQKKMLRTQVFDLIVATPGRLLDFKRQKIINLKNVEILVIDEADRMLDMGFIPDIRKIVYSTPEKKFRQTMFFSATLTPDVIRLASQWTRKPYQVEIEPEQIAAKSINQVTYIVTEEEKFTLLYNLITQQKLERVLVFSNTREETRNLVSKVRSYKIDVSLLSGEVSQVKRIKTLERFKKGDIRVLVATDVAARGIHVEAISHVVNYTLPQDPEDYVHRIGRTGRAGESGIAISFASEGDSFYIPAIEELLGHSLKCEYPAEKLLSPLPPPPAPLQRKSGPKKKSTGKPGYRKKKQTGANRKKRYNSGSRRPRRRNPQNKKQPQSSSRQSK